MSEDMFPALPGAKSMSTPEQGGGMPGGMLDGSPSSLVPQQPILVEDRHKLLGLLDVVRQPKPDLKMMALGVDLTTLGLNLNSADVLFPNFESPWADGPLRPKEPQFQLPSCYTVKANLPPIAMRLQNVTDETLFYVFYGMPGDICQLASAVIL